MKFLILSLLFLFHSASSHAAVIGDLDWQNINELSLSDPVRVNSFAIGNLDIPLYESRCSGFLISPDVLMTNQHCIETQIHAWDVSVKFNFLQDVPDNLRQEFKCNEFIGMNKELDFALLRCKGRPGELVGYLSLDTEDVLIKDPAYVIQQNCNHKENDDCEPYKKVAFGEIQKTNVRNKIIRLQHNIDSMAGSSGSPLFSKFNHKVVAIHHAGVTSNGVGLKNYAVKMSKIVPAIKRDFPNILPRRSKPTILIPKNHNSLESAFEVPKLPLNLLSIPMSGESEHYYTLQLKPGKLDLTLTQSNGSENLIIKLYNKAGILLRRNTESSKSKSISFRTLGGEYYIKIYSLSPTNTEYNINFITSR